MKVGIVGLGLIGGSFAKAYSEAGHEVLALDTDAGIMGFAKLSGDVTADLSKENIGGCDLILICVYPQAAIDFMKEYGSCIGKRPVVIDCCGTKRDICEAGFELAGKYDFTYIGGHPMAGKQYSGFKYAKANLYNNAPMVLVPSDRSDIILLNRVKELLKPAGFGRISVTTPEQHDEMIAFTSQLAHIVSNAYIKSPTARAHKGFSAGSYKDMTRVAWLNPQMWTELCMDNRDNILKEMDILIENLNAYRKAVAENDSATLEKLFLEGKLLKEEVDG